MDIWAQMSTMHLLWFIEHITFSITRFVEKVYIIYNTYYYVKSTSLVLCTFVMVHKGMSSSYRSVDCIGL